MDWSAEWTSRIWLIYWWKWNGWERGFLWNAQREIINSLKCINSKSKEEEGGDAAHSEYILTPSAETSSCGKDRKYTCKVRWPALAVRPRPPSCWSDASFHTAGTFRFPAPPSNPTVCSQGNVWKWIMEISDGETWCISVSFSPLVPWSAPPTYEGRSWKYRTLSGREAHRGPSSSRGAGQSIYLPVAWARLIQALSQVDLSPTPAAAGRQTDKRRPSFF